jgi:hypothetical protein
VNQIKINFINHNDQVYETCGDFNLTPDGDLEVRISKLGNPTWELAIAVHELIEQHLCTLAGINFKDIDNFDIAYEYCRKNEMPLGCGCPIQEEPGMDEHAPYHSQHVFATELERQFVDEAGWIQYDRAVDNLEKVDKTG